jgi:hypothetical protein
MDLICDTNVWYKIGFGETDPNLIKASGHRLLATPLSLLELISNIDEANFGMRRNAASAVVEHASEILPDPEHYLASIWQVPEKFAAFDWQLGFQTLAQAPDLAGLAGGVVDPSKGIRVAVNVPFARTWRADRYEKFEQDMLRMMDQFWPGYAAARADGKSIHMPKQLGELFDKATQYPEMLTGYVLATYARAVQLPDGSTVDDPPMGVLADANERLMPYARVYQKYVVKIATTFAPQPNDLGDLECFIYAQDGRAVFTYEKKWNTIAADAGCSQYVFVPA